MKKDVEKLKGWQLFGVGEEARARMLRASDSEVWVSGDDVVIDVGRERLYVPRDVLVALLSRVDEGREGNG